MFRGGGKKTTSASTASDTSCVSVLQDSASPTDVSGPRATPKSEGTSGAPNHAFSQSFFKRCCHLTTIPNYLIRNNRMRIADAVPASMQVTWNRTSVTDWAGTVFVEHMNRWSENSLTISLIKIRVPQEIYVGTPG